MPIFDIRCTRCHLITRDVFLLCKLSAFICKCGAVDQFKRLPSSPAIHFKGKGWSK